MKLGELLEHLHMKLCTNCQVNKDFSEFGKAKAHKDGLKYICKPCEAERNRAHRAKNADRYYARQKERRNGFEGCMKDTLFQAKTRAAKKKLSFDITVEDLIDLYHSQGGKCAITGLDLELESKSRKHKNGFKVSLDRIDSDEGYVLGNLQFVCWAVNQIKLDRPEEEMLFWCKRIVSSYEGNQQRSTIGTYRERSTTREKSRTLQANGSGSAQPLH